MSSDRDPRAVVLVHATGGRPIRLTSVERSTRCDLGLVDDLLRMRVVAARLGWTIEIVAVSSEIRELFELVGLIEQLATP